MQENGLIRKIRVIYDDVITWLTKNCNTYIDQYFKKSKGHQTMKFGQLKVYNLENILLEKSYTKYGGETIPRPLEKLFPAYLWINCLRFYTICFYCIPN